MTKSIISLVAVSSSLQTAAWDGNPHHWGRLRRCDLDPHYDPPCGLCEGIGGIVWSDALDAIDITKCEAIATPDKISPKPVPPSLPLKFSNAGFYEILITQKTNEFCIGGFPGPDSRGTHCYARQEGTFIYDWSNNDGSERAPELRIDYNIKGLVNETTSIFHKKADMWIVNHFPLNSRQCICTYPGRSFGVPIYPINPDFMNKDSKYLGRENLYIEFLWRNEIVDHWVKGPHHIWTQVSSGKIIRMWQPWNGLEVFDPAKWTDGNDDSGKLVMPPTVCVKATAGWNDFRVKCTDDGFPTDDPHESVTIV